MIFRGTFEYALDAKHRLTVPAKYRAALAGGVVLAFSPETETGSARSLSIWPTEDYDAYAQAALADVNPLLPHARKMQRLLNSNSFDLELDSANRLMIPAGAGVRRPDQGGRGHRLGPPAWRSGTARPTRATTQAALASFPEIAASFDHTD